MTTINSSVRGLHLKGKTAVTRMKKVSLIIVYLIWEERNKRVFENSCSFVEPIFRRFQVIFYMILRFHQRDIPVLSWLVADRYGVAIHWSALRWVALGSLCCYCSYWVLVLLLCRACCFDVHGFIHGFLVPALAIPVSAWKGLYVTVAFSGWFLAGGNFTSLHGCFLWLVFRWLQFHVSPWLLSLVSFALCLCVIGCIVGCIYGSGLLNALCTTRKPEKTNGITDGIFPSVIITDGNNSVSNSVGIYRQHKPVSETVGIYRRFRRLFRRYIPTVSPMGYIYSLSGNMQRRGDVRRFYRRNYRGIQTEIAVQWRGTVTDGITDGVLPSVIPSEKTIICPRICRHSLPLFLLLLLSHPTSPLPNCSQTPIPTLHYSQHEHSSFLYLVRGHNIRFL